MTVTHHRQVGEVLYEVIPETSKGDNIRGTSAAIWLKRDKVKIIEIRWFGIVRTL